MSLFICHTRTQRTIVRDAHWSRTLRLYERPARARVCVIFSTHKYNIICMIIVNSQRETTISQRSAVYHMIKRSSVCDDEQNTPCYM